MSECCNGSRKSVSQGLGVLTLALLFLVSWAFPSFFLSISLSFSPSSCNKTFERARQLTHSERITRSSRHHAFLRSWDLETICIRANWLSLVRDFPTLHMVLEAAIPVSCFYSTGQTRLCALRMSRYVASITFTWNIKSCLKYKQPCSDFELVSAMSISYNTNH